MEWLAPILVMLPISAAYFWLGGNSSTKVERVFVSVHGLSASALYLGALAAWQLTQAHRPWAGWPYLLLHAAPLASIVYALFRFQGPKLLHFTQFANIAAMAQAFFVGGMAITGDWL